MKTNKEYPATHSMDTAWFAVDMDGNVAIFQFEENGPGPIPFTDVHTDELIPMLGEKDDLGVHTMPFTNEQIEELMKDLKPVSIFDDIRHSCNLLIDPLHFYEILAYEPKFDLCYSKELGFYHLDYWRCDKCCYSAIEEFIKKGYILAAQECDIEIYFEDYRDDQTEHRLARFPFFVYEQDYSCNEAPRRVVTPAHPLKEEQMSTEAKQYMFRLPIRFAEESQVEPAEFIDSQCWTFLNEVKEIEGIKYMKLKLTNGEEAYVKVKPHSYDTIDDEDWENAPRIVEL